MSHPNQHLEQDKHSSRTSSDLDSHHEDPVTLVTSHDNDGYDSKSRMKRGDSTNFNNTTNISKSNSEDISVDEEEEEEIEQIYYPKNEQRGFFSRVLLVKERVDPYQYSPLTKNMILVIIAYAGIVGPMGGSVFLPAIESINEDLHISRDVVNVSYGIYVLSLAIFPLWWSSFSEQFGRRNIYIISFSAYLLFLIGCARAKSIGTLMGCRFLAGACAGSVQAVGAGTLADIFVPTDRGSAMGYFYLGPLLGPLLGPIFGGLIVSKWGWRGTQWFLVIIAGSIILCVVFLLPETLHKRQHSSSAKSKDPQQGTNTQISDAGSKTAENITVRNSQSSDDSSSHSDITSINDSNPTNIITKEKINDSKVTKKNYENETNSNTVPNYNRRSSVSSKASNIADEVDNSNVGDTFIPIMPTPSHPDDQDPRWLEPISSQYLEAQNTKKRPTAEDDLEAQTNDLDHISKIKTSRSEKERRLIRSSGQIDFNSLTLKEKLNWLFLRPLKTFKFLKYQPVALTILYGSICFTVLYFLNVGLETLYSSEPYNFSSIYVGLTYIPNSLGYVISSVVAGRYSDYVVRKEKKLLGYFNAESRFAEHVYIAMVIYPISIIFFGWTAYYKVHWVVPLVASFLFGLSSMVVLGNSATYLVDALPGKGSSGIALNNFVRFILAAIATFVAEPMKNGMGFGWMYTMLGLIAVVSSIAVIAIKKWGLKWRGEADFEKLYS